MGQDSNKKPSGWDWLFRTSLPLESETTVFIFVSALDIFMTWILLSQGGFRESNPIAEYFLNRWGRRGFVGFKFGIVTFICLITQLIALQKPDVAKRVLNLGTLVVTAVVIYSLTLFLRSQSSM